MSSCHALNKQLTALQVEQQQQQQQSITNKNHNNNNNSIMGTNFSTTTTTTMNQSSLCHTQQQQLPPSTSTSISNGYHQTTTTTTNHINNNNNITNNNCALPNNQTLTNSKQPQQHTINNITNNNTTNFKSTSVTTKQTVQNHVFDTPIESYQVTDVIGSGTYGVVAICKDHTDQQYALKKNIRVFPDENDLNGTNSNNSSGSSGSSSGNGKYTAFNNSGKLHQLRMLRELKLLHHFRNCQYIVSLKDVYVPSQLNELRDIEMVTSLMEADLRDIFDSAQVLSPKHVKWFLYQICLSVYYMQKAKILHRDLKPENILVNSQCDISICDFGLARGYYNSNQILKNINNKQQTNCNSNNNSNNTTSNNNTTTSNNTDSNSNSNTTSSNEDLNDVTRLSSNYVVSRWYRPPELLTNATQIYNKTLDIWSVGCIMYELLSGKGEVLFKGSGSIDQIQRIVKQLGTPLIEDFNGSDAARDYIYNKFPICKRRSFTKRLPPNTCPMAIDLMKRMLTFNMYKRITPLDALLHPYFREFYDASDLSIPLSPFDTAWEDTMFSSNDLKIEAFNTLHAIKRDHQRELIEQQSPSLMEESNHNLFMNDDDDDVIDDIDEEFEDFIEPPESSLLSSNEDSSLVSSGGGGGVGNSNGNSISNSGSMTQSSCPSIASSNCCCPSTSLSSTNVTSNSSTQQDDFLMMVVDNYNKNFLIQNSPTTTTTSSNNDFMNECTETKSVFKYSTQPSVKSQQHIPSSIDDLMDGRSASVEVNISYQTTRV